MEDLKKRLDAVERQNRWLTRTVMLMALALVGGLAVGWTSPDGVVKAQSFVLGDKDGTPRALLHVLDDGSPCLTFCDKNGEMRAGLGMNKDDTPYFALYRDMTTRAGLTLAVDGSPRLVFCDKDRKARADLSLTADGSPFLALCDKDGESRVGMAVRLNGSPSLSLDDANKVARVDLHTDKDGSPTLELHDAAGKTTWSARK